MNHSKTLYGIYSVDTSLSQKTLFSHIEKEIMAALQAGLPWIQFRDKSYNKELWPLWADLTIAAQELGTQVIVNDQVDLVEHLQRAIPNKTTFIPGLHIGQTDQPLHIVQQRVLPNTSIGITCHNDIELALQAAQDGAHYVAFGRFFSSSTKPQAPPASLSTINQFHAQDPTPIAVIGGINIQNIQKLLPTAASLYAVSQGIWGQGSISAAVTALIATLEREKPLT